MRNLLFLGTWEILIIISVLIITHLLAYKAGKKSK